MVCLGEERGSSAHWSSHLSDCLQGDFIFSEKLIYRIIIIVGLYSIINGCRLTSGYRQWLMTSSMSVMTPIRKDLNITLYDPKWSDLVRRHWPRNAAFLVIFSQAGKIHGDRKEGSLSCWL